MALPAIVDEGGRVAWAAASIEGWHGVDLVTSLRASFGLPAVALFDGYAATEGEATFGAGRGVDSLVTLIVGTGLGAGVWLDGRVVEGRTGVAGAVGWSRWPMPDGSISAPVESIASGTGILAEARRRGRPADYPDTPAVFARAAAGDEAAQAAITLAVTAAGTVAAHIIDLLAPQLVVWSGGVGSRADFSGRATAVAQQSCQPYAATRTQFKRSSLGAESSLAGAAARALSIAKGEDPR
jgi:predicted NBD/HSP70 family sugar kinase